MDGEIIEQPNGLAEAQEPAGEARW